MGNGNNDGIPIASVLFNQPNSRQLGQLRPADTTAASIYSPLQGVRTNIRTIVIANTTASQASYRIFHDDNGTTYDETTALYFDRNIPANNTDILNDLDIGMDDPDGNIGVRTNTSNALTFTIYGQETER
jgi:hypothetical protein